MVREKKGEEERCGKTRNAAGSRALLFNTKRILFHLLAVILPAFGDAFHRARVGEDGGGGGDGTTDETPVRIFFPSAAKEFILTR